MTTQDPFANNKVLLDLVRASGLTLIEVLARFNARQARPIAMRTLNSYLAREGAKTRARCPDTVLAHMLKVITRHERRASANDLPPSKNEI